MPATSTPTSCSCRHVRCLLSAENVFACGPAFSTKNTHTQRQRYHMYIYTYIYAHPPQWTNREMEKKSKNPKIQSSPDNLPGNFGVLDFVLFYACLCFLCFFVLFCTFLNFFALFAIFCTFFALFGTFCTFLHFFALLAHFCIFLHFLALLSNFTTFLQIFVLLNVLFQSKSPKIRKPKNPKFSGQSPRKLWIFGFLDFEDFSHSRFSFFLTYKRAAIHMYPCQNFKNIPTTQNVNENPK